MRTIWIAVAALALIACADGGQPVTGASSTAGAGGAGATTSSGAATTAASGGIGGGVSCNDGEKNGNETGADCGGGDCQPCADGLTCAAPEDCEGTCFAGLCRCGTPQFNLTISHVRTRGNDLVELYNPTSGPITTDATWSLEWAPAVFPVKYEIVKLGSHQIQPGGVLVIESPAAPTCADVTLAAAQDIPNSGSVRLRRSGDITVDAVCFFVDPAEASMFADVSFTCEGEPAANASDTGDGLARAPGGAEGPCSDLGSSAIDFHVVSPSVPSCGP